MSVPVSVILERKGTACHTIRPDESVAEVARRLAEHNIGALVVSSDERSAEGVVSERDLVRALAESGDAVLSYRVADVMTSPVTTCARSTTTDEVMATMTERRIRHVPVVDGDRLVGIVSIGDVVKWRMDELAEDAERLQEYVTGSY